MWQQPDQTLTKQFEQESVTHDYEHYLNAMISHAHS